MLTLDLSGQHLRQLPDELFELTELEALKLDANRCIRLSEKLIKLTNLKVLSLVGCNLETVPAVVMELQQLETLVLNENKNITLPDEMCSLVNLTCLNLHSCGLTSVPAVVMKLSRLKGLGLFNNKNIKLPDEMPSLVNLAYLNLTTCDMGTLPPVVLKLLNLQTLDLSKNSQISLSEELCRLDNMKVLTLRDCNLTTVPSAVLKLTQLEELDLSYNSKIYLPDGLTGLTNIRVLKLWRMDMVTVPPVVWRLTQLERLDLRDNPHPLPAEVGQLNKVKHLNLSNCELHTLPSELGRLAQLEWLDLRFNSLQTLPAEVGQLSNIERFYLSHCRLRTLPPEVGRLTQLEWLDLSCNPLQTLPAEVGQLTNVKHLDLSYCKLHTLPTEVGRLTQLEWLDLAYNPLQTLPAEVGQLTNVKHLDLSYCKLHTLPPEVGRLTQLEWLDLRSNPLQTLPAEVGQLNNAKHLDLSTCQLHTLPPEVLKLTQLDYLNLSSNPQKMLPAGPGRLIDTKRLYLPYCKLRTLPPEVGRLTQLEWLELGSNPLQTLPAEIGQLTNVKYLDLSHCQLHTLPPEVGRLTKLEWLDLSFNQLQTLPAEVGQLSSTCNLDVDGNPLIKPPAEVCSEGIDAIRQYFEELERSDEKVSARLKVVVLGEKMAGKTSLVRTLVSGVSTLTEEEDRTHCVEITQWTPDDNITFEVYDFGGHDVYHLTHRFFLTQGALNLLTVNLKTYRCTEQSYREAIGFWLDTLNARVPGAVVTIVGSKTDMCSDADIEEKTRDIQERFKQQNDVWQETIRQQITKLENARTVKDVKVGTDQEEVQQQLERTRQLLTRPLRLTGVFCVSSAESTSGLDTLKSHIVESANNTQLFPILRIILPQTWAKFEKRLRNLRDRGTETGNSDVSTQSWYFSDYSFSLDSDLDSGKPVWLTRDECLQHGKRAGLIEDRLEPVLSYLQQVGTILRYTDIPELKDFVFHDPSGLIDVIKELFHHDLVKVFTNKNPRLKGFSNTKLKKIRRNLLGRGFLPREVVSALLGPHATPVGNVDVITNLMEHFGLCYAEWSDEHDGQTSTPTGYCIPWYIREERPKTVKRIVRKRQKKGFTVTCEIAGFCPRGLFERLSVVVNKLIKSRQDWKDTIVAVSDLESLPVIVYRETKHERVNIVVKLTVPAGFIKGAWVVQEAITSLKDKLVTLLKEWPGLLYHLVHSTFTQHGEKKDITSETQQGLTISATIPTFEVGLKGCTVQQSGVTLEFPEGSVRETRFISVEVETVPVTDDVRTNFTAMSAVLTVEQDFQQRFLRPVTVRLPWVWTRSAVGKETKTVVLHYGLDDGWTLFKTYTHEEDGGVMFQIDHFQGYWVLEVLRNRSKDIVSWVQRTWRDYIKDKAYVIVTPVVTERLLHLICMHKSDNLPDLFVSPDVRFDSQTKRRVALKRDQRVEATFSQHEDVAAHPRDLPKGKAIVLSPPATRTVRLKVKESVPMKDVYDGKVEFEIKGTSNLTGTGGGQQFEAFVQLRQRQQGLSERTPSHQHHEARPESNYPPPPRTRRHVPVFPTFLAMAMVAAVVAAVSQLYFAGPISDFFGPQIRKEDGFQHTSYFGTPVVLLVNDEYGTSKGGISTINRQLAKLISSTGAKVLCTVLNASEVNEARADGVELVFPTSLMADKRQPTLDWLTFDHLARYPNLSSDIAYIIGHVSITSSAARNIREQRYPGAKLILFNHVIPEDTEHYKSESRELGIGEKSDAIRTDMEHADVVFSVGPNLYDYYKNQIRGSKPHYEFLPKPSDIFSQMNLTYVETETKIVLSIGRVKGAERLKGYDLAAKAMSMVIDRFPKARWRVRGVSAEDFPESKEIIQANVEKGTFHFTPLKHGTHQQLSRDMKEAHVVLMPSRAEPFGLVGLEAIAAGVPTVVSQNSGLAKFLKAQDDVDFDRPIVKIKGNDNEDGARLADRIIDILENGSKEFKAAKQLKQKLMESKYWEESHRKFLEECDMLQ
ncbi:MFHAS1 [Branchiostoma lanceolatum]|uniref:Leucine-rich repeat protein SHOC-2 n=1 Tax=Branchiostoma lanceolatum TaxID=7740 RepID=A0A8J9VRT8_BRALA|nr:MFHAS1 [Branchiostoma lanceolatum]